MQLLIKTDCTYFHKGYDRRDYVAGETVETDDQEFAQVATSEGWATEATGKPAPEAAPAKKTSRAR